MSFWGHKVDEAVFRQWQDRAIWPRDDKSWIQTWSGRQFWPLDPRPEEVHVIDVAWMLAGQNRWRGATHRQLINIAQHSVIVSELCDPEYALQGLVHDAPEAYLGDMAGPVKKHLPDFQRAEDHLWKTAVAPAFGVPVEMHESVIRADQVSLHTEARDLMRPPPVEWRGWLPPPMAERISNCWDAPFAAAQFIARYEQLTGKKVEL